jgi:hypothetical protein
MAYSRAITHVARVAAIATNRALSDQTGFPERPGKKAVTQDGSVKPPSAVRRILTPTAPVAGDLMLE